MNHIGDAKSEAKDSKHVKKKGLEPKDDNESDTMSVA